VKIALTKRTDGNSVLRCERDDGTIAWQKQEGGQARFFPFHDLTHYAVETALGARDGFYGLIAAGWEIADTTGKGARGALPPEAIVVEQIVGMLDRERAGGVRWPATDFTDTLAATGSASPPLTDALLDEIRSRVDGLHARWRLLPASESLELTF
jgi:hypothetical protein